MYRADDYMVRPVKVLLVVGAALLVLAAADGIAHLLGGAGMLAFVLGFIIFIVGICLIFQTKGDGRLEALAFLLRTALILAILLIAFLLLIPESSRNPRIIPYMASFAVPFGCAVVLTFPKARKRKMLVITSMALLFVACIGAAVYQQTQMASFYDQIEARYGGLLREEQGIKVQDADGPKTVCAVIYDADSGLFLKNLDYPDSPDEVTVIIIRSKKEVTRYSSSRWYVDSAGNPTSPVNSSRAGVDSSVQTTDRYLDIKSWSIYDTKKKG